MPLQDFQLLCVSKWLSRNKHVLPCLESVLVYLATPVVTGEISKCSLLLKPKCFELLCQKNNSSLLLQVLSVLLHFAIFQNVGWKMQKWSFSCFVGAFLMNNLVRSQHGALVFLVIASQKIYPGVCQLMFFMLITNIYKCSVCMITNL